MQQQKIDSMTSYKECSWHPFYTKTTTAQEKEAFNQVLGIVNKLRSAMSQRSSDYPRRSDQGILTNQVYGVTLSNSHHPQNHVESWWWVDTSDWQTWWPSPIEQGLLNNHGWTIKAEHYSHL